MDSGLAGKSEKPTWQRPGMTPRGACCGRAKMQHCDGFAAVQLSNPAVARTIALSLCAPCAVTRRQAPVVRLNQAGAFSLPPPHPFRRRGKCRGGFDIAPTNAVRIRRGESGSKNATRFLGCPALARPLFASLLLTSGRRNASPLRRFASAGAGFKPAPTISPLARRVFFSPPAPDSANDSRTSANDSHVRSNARGHAIDDVTSDP
jgi:hypothetical protein